jgi:predicted alpha/beta-fold hydrolase
MTTPVRRAAAVIAGVRDVPTETDSWDRRFRRIGVFLQVLSPPAMALFALYLAIRRARHSETPTVLAANTDRNRRILSMCPSFHRYVPTPWLPVRHGNALFPRLIPSFSHPPTPPPYLSSVQSGHVQTIYCGLMREYPNVAFDRVFVQMSDGGVLALDVVDAEGRRGRLRAAALRCGARLQDSFPASRLVAELHGEEKADEGEGGAGGAGGAGGGGGGKGGGSVGVDGVRVREDGDGDEDEDEGVWLERSHPTLVILHGLSGGSHERYVQHSVREALRQGFSVVVQNARGCGGSRLVTARTFSAAFTDDPKAVFSTVGSWYGPAKGDGGEAGASRQQKPPVYGMGFSLGAGILSKYVCEAGEHTPLRAAVACCASFDLLLSSQTMDANQFPIIGGWTHVLTNGLHRWVARHTDVLHEATWLDRARLARARTIREFDASAIVPQFGYESVDHYYRDGSTAHRLQAEVRIPFLALNAEDDPICDARGIPRDAPARNENLLFVLTREGGHVAWATGWTPWTGASWGEIAAVEFIRAVHDLDTQE